MFNFFKKRARQDALIAAVRETMSKDSSNQNLRMMSPGALEHKFIKKYLSVEEAEKEHMVMGWERRGNSKGALIVLRKPTTRQQVQGSMRDFWGEGDELVPEPFQGATRWRGIYRGCYPRLISGSPPG
jgi:hypothetical protein